MGNSNSELDDKKQRQIEENRKAGIKETKRPDIKKRLKKADIPKTWLSKIKKPDGSYKKVVLYAPALPAFVNDPSSAVDKMTEVMQIFDEQSENITVWWRPHPLVETILKGLPSEEEKPEDDLYSLYRDIVDDFISKGEGIYDESDDIERAALVADAYYGGHRSVLQLCQKQRMPIMIENVDIRTHS